MILTSHEKKTHARFNASHYLFILTEMFGPFNIVTTKSDLANRYILIQFFFFFFFITCQSCPHAYMAKFWDKQLIPSRGKKSCF